VIDDVKKFKVIHAAIANGRFVGIADEKIKRLLAIKKYENKVFRYYISIAQVKKE